MTEFERQQKIDMIKSSDAPYEVKQAALAKLEPSDSTELARQQFEQSKADAIGELD